MADKLTATFADVLMIDPASLNDDSSPDTIAEWDSTANMMLIAAIEEVFSVELTSMDIESMKTLGIVRRILIERNVAI
jgi:acyl carrier protein